MTSARGGKCRMSVEIAPRAPKHTPHPWCHPLLHLTRDPSPHVLHRRAPITWRGERVGGAAVAAGRILSLEITGQILLRVPKDFDDRPAVIDREPSIPRVLLAPGKNLPHAPVDRLFGLAWEGIELRRVHHIAAGIAHQALA